MGEHVVVLIDPEKYEASEEQFAASLSDMAPASEARSNPAPLAAITPTERGFRDGKSSGAMATAAIAIKESRPAESPEWKNEVSSRVSRYRSRRRSRSEHSRSMALDFEALADADGMEAVAREPRPQNNEFKGDTLSQLTETVRAMEMKNYVEISEAEAKVIEFPRPADIENIVELAEPVVPPPPRIFEAEDVEQAARTQEGHEAAAVAPPVPTFMLDSIPMGEIEEPEFELPLPVAPVALRLFGLGIDLAVVCAACLLFGATLFLMSSVPPDRSGFGLAALFGVAAWCTYQNLFLTRQGSTPGMRAVGLALTGFEQQPVTGRELKLRAWSVMLSSVSLGLGFAWALLDEDRLCWHDRISRTCTIKED